jgi:hypothetical protein
VERIRSLRERTFLSPPFLFLAVLCLLAGGCATGGRRDLGPVTMQTAQQAYAPDQLLDIGIEIFSGGTTNEAELADQHSTPQIRQSETHYMAYHLKGTLERSGYWGDVRVVPANAGNIDVRVRGEILYSNGERMAVRVRAEDAQGYLWYNRVYQDKASKQAYTDAKVGETDPFQNIYNAIANDLAAVRRTMDPSSVKVLRRATSLRFAAEVVPEAFGQYLEADAKGKLQIVRLPAEDDPMWQRVGKIGTRNAMYFDTLNAYYDPYYQRMWSAYLDWRKFNLVEQVSLREAKRDGLKQAAAGIIMIAAAILLEVNDVKNTSTLRNVLVLAGSQVVVNGINVSKAAKIHAESLKELGESFSSDVSSVVVSLEGETVTLTGTAEEQMRQWRDLLGRIARAENELPVPASSGPEP